MTLERIRQFSLTNCLAFSLIIPWKYKHIYKATARKVKIWKGGWGTYPSVPGIMFHKIRRC